MTRWIEVGIWRIDLNQVTALENLNSAVNVRMSGGDMISLPKEQGMLVWNAIQAQPLLPGGTVPKRDEAEG